MFSFVNTDIVWQDRDPSDKKRFPVPPIRRKSSNINKSNFHWTLYCQEIQKKTIDDKIRSLYQFFKTNSFIRKSEKDSH